jgi:hypothetical protein
MNLLAIIEALRRNLKAVVATCYGILTLVVIADLVRVMTAHEPAVQAGEAAASAEHATGFWATLYHLAETVPVFWTVFGFLGCVLLVVVSKGFGHLGVSEREDYYDE